MTATRALSAADIPWQDILIWSGLLLILYALHEVFAVVFLTFLLTYLVRAIVVPLARRIRPGQENRSLERWLTLGTFLAIVLLLWGLARLMAPQFVLQGRLLAAHAERLEPQAVLDHVLARTVGAYLFSKTYGTPDDPRHQAGITAFAAENRAGEGAYAGFGQLRTRVQSGFEIAYETAARGRLEHETGERGDIGQDFDTWFLSVKAPALVAERRATYLARLQTPDGQSRPADAAGPEPRLAELALQDLDANPGERARLVSQWEQARAEAQWRQLQASPEYRAAFESWFAGPGGMAEKLPYDAVTYLALRDAYPRGLAAFKQVYQERVATTPAGVAAERLDFQRAKELELARQWWSQSPAASSLREHLQKDATEVASAAAERITTAVRGLIAIPAQLGTALLLTILISFDMVGLKRGARRLRESRLAGVYEKVVPNLTAVARLIGRSFAAQGVIAVFNTLLTFALMRLLGLQNELLLACIVFIASMIPVLGIIVSAVPIGLQALLQPDGSLELALYALLGIAVIHAIESMVLSPKIVGKILHLHPVLVLAILVIGEHLFGIWGLLLGVPLAVYAIHAGILREGIPGIYEPSKAAPP
jgi:predicted PurR-regulated permease PerM